MRAHDLRPAWVALDDSTLGYDVKSWRAGQDGWSDPRPWHIEVKAALHQRRFFLTRNEWRFAQRHADSWELQFWLLEQSDPILLSFATVADSVPADVGSGEWTSIEIRVRSDSEL